MSTELSAVQAEFLLGDAAPKIDFSKEKFSYTSERLWRDRPDVAKAALRLLAEPREVMPFRRIMARLHMSYHLLRNLEISSAPAIAKEKKTLGDLMYTATEAFVERAIELAPEMKNGKDVMIAAGIGADKFLGFRGEATQRIEINATVNVQSKMDGLYAKMQEKFEEMKLAKAHVVEPAAIEESHTEDTGAQRFE
jgi:hypothetical protein